MAAFNPYYNDDTGWTPLDELSPDQLALMNPGGYRDPGLSMPTFDMGLINQINNQGTTQANPGGGSFPNSGMPFDNMASSYPYNTVYNGPQANAPQVDPPAPPPALPPASNPTYPTGGANNMGMTGAENVGGVGMYTGSNGPLDTTRFNPQSNLDFVRNIDQPTYYRYVLPFQQAGGDITNQAAVRQAIENGLRQSGGGTYAVGSQTFNVARTQPTPTTPSQPNNQPVQYSGPQPPLPQQPQPQQPFNPAMAYRLPQPTSPSNPFASMLQNPFGLPMGQPNGFYNPGNPGAGGLDPRQQQQATYQQYADSLTPQDYIMGADGVTRMSPAAQARWASTRQQLGMPTPTGSGYWGGQQQQPDPRSWQAMGINTPPQQNPQQIQIQQMIARAMAQGAIGGGASIQGYPSQFANHMMGYPTVGGFPTGGLDPASQLFYGSGNQRPGGQQSQQPQWSSDPAMNQARMFDMYSGGQPQQYEPLPQIDYRAATFGGQSQRPETTTPSYSTPSASSNTMNSSNPWANINNRLPSYNNSYSYGWDR